MHSHASRELIPILSGLWFNGPVVVNTETGNVVLTFLMLTIYSKIYYDTSIYGLNEDWVWFDLQTFKYIITIDIMFYNETFY